MGLVLAAGLGTRMRSPLAKVLHPLCGRPMVRWVVDAVQAAGLEPVVVVHHQEEAVRAALPGVRCARQEAPRGTGDAVRAAAAALPPTGVVVVVPGDVPLLEPAVLQALLSAHGDALCTVLSTVVADPAEYGRIVRDGERVVRIVEAAECTEEERAIPEVNAGVYAFDARWLRDEVLPALQPHPPKGELYLTDAVAMAAAAGRLQARCHADPGSLVGVNDRWALALAEDVLQERILAEHGRRGVTFHRPATVRVEAEVVLAPDVEVDPGAVLRGRTRVAEGARIGAGVVLEDTLVGPGAHVLPGSVCEGAEIGAAAEVGPMAHLRRGTHLGPRTRVGNFVETKNTTLAEGVKASHLSYLGDATVGEGTNVGAGTITCNYDGFRKHRTRIGRDVFVGSNTSLVAPLRIGDGALVGAGSVVTTDVPPEALAVARARQVNYPDGALTIREQFRERARHPPGDEEEG